MKKIVIAGGGTGGHIYPGIAIAQAIEKSDPLAQVVFIGAKGGLEEKILPREKYHFFLLKIGKLKNESVLTKFITILFLPCAFIKSFYLLRKIRPDFVLGVGGYASGPFVLTAVICQVPTAIWEPNVFPGLANRLLSKYVKYNFVVFAEAAQFLPKNKVIKVGMPVRKKLTVNTKQIEFDKLTDKFHILIFGGSQGSQAINRVVAQAITQGGAWLNDTLIVHQTGKYDFTAIAQLYKPLGKNIEAHEYLHDMHCYYNWANLVVCRAGASTLAELAAYGKAAILIPLPTAADDHQYKNAKVLADAQAAKLIHQADFNATSFINLVSFFKKNVDELSLIEQNIRLFHNEEAGEQIASILLV